MFDSIQLLKPVVPDPQDMAGDPRYEVLKSFDAIVTNVANSYRLQEECDVISLRMAKIPGLTAGWKCEMRHIDGAENCKI